MYVNSGAGHLIYINSDGACFKKYIRQLILVLFHFSPAREKDKTAFEASSFGVDIYQVPCAGVSPYFQELNF